MRFTVGGVINLLNDHGVEKLPLQQYWYHSCTSVDTESGRVLIAINGITITDQIFPTLVNSSADRPTNLKGKLLLGKTWAGFWYQGRERVTNINVFSWALSESEALRRTGPEGCGVGDGDHLAWPEADWLLEGATTRGTVGREQLCKRPEDILLFTSAFLKQEWCMQHCYKIQRGRGVPVTTQQHNAFKKKILLQLFVFFSESRAGTEGPRNISLTLVLKLCS
jgi:hypothetical protein